MAIGIGKTQVDAASLEVLAQLVNLNLQRETVMRNLLLDLSSEAQAGVDKIKVRKFTDLSVGTKAEGTAVTFGGSTLSTDDLLLDQHKYVAFDYEEFAQLQAPQMFMQELAVNAAIKMAQTYDAALISMINGGATAGSLPGGAGVIDKDAFIEGRRLLQTNNVPMGDRYVGIHPDDYADVLKITAFVNAESYGQSNIASGEVGQIFGVKVIENAGFTAGQLVFWHKNAGCGAIQLSPSIRTQYSVAKLADEWVLHTVYGTKILKALAAHKLT
jgi:hypothetical protein